MYVSVCMPLGSFSWVLGGESSRCGESRCALLCHKKRDISRRCRNQQRGGQSGRLTSECSETTPTWIRRYNPGQALVNPSVCSRPHPDSLRPVAVRWVIASRPGPSAEELLSIYLPPPLPSVRISPSLQLSPKKKMFPSPLFSLFLPSSRFPLTSFFLQQTRFRVPLGPHERPSLAF